MSDYYIRITDEEPVEMEKGVRFKYDGTGSEADFTIVEENAYRTMISQFESFSQSTENIINYNLDNLLIYKSIPLARASKSIVDEDNENSISYDDLANLLTDHVSISSIDNVNSSINDMALSIESMKSDIATLNSTKATIAQVNSLQSNITNTLKNYYTKSETNSLLSGKSNTNHTHGWTYKKLNNYAVLYYNDAIKMVSFRYYRSSYNFKEAGTTVIHKGLIPSAYRPKVYGDVILPTYNVHMVAHIESESGDLRVGIESGNTGNRPISVYGMWKY